MRFSLHIKVTGMVFDWLSKCHYKRTTFLGTTTATTILIAHDLCHANLRVQKRWQISHNPSLWWFTVKWTLVAYTFCLWLLFFSFRIRMLELQWKSSMPTLAAKSVKKKQNWQNMPQNWWNIHQLNMNELVNKSKHWYGFEIIFQLSIVWQKNTHTK